MDIAKITAALDMAINGSIEKMEAQMLEQPQVDIAVQYMFVNGMYVRHIVIPAGTILTGRVHKFGYVDIMLKGHIFVATPDGVKEMKGYNILEGKKGRKRAGLAVEDTHWVTVHRTDETDPNGIEDKLTVMTIQQYEALPDSEKGELPCQLLQQQ